MPSIVLAVAIGVLLYSVLLWTAAWQRWRTGEPLIPRLASTPAPWGLIDLALAAGLWLLINVGAAAMALALVQKVPDGSPEGLDPTAQIPLLLIGSLASLGTCLLVLAALWFRHRVTTAELGWDPRHLVGDVMLGIRAFVMLSPIVYGLQMLLTQIFVSKHPLIELLKENPNPRFFAIAMFAAVVVAPLVEEFLFRVLLQGWLERMFARNREPTEMLVFGGRTTPTPTPAPST